MLNLLLPSFENGGLTGSLKVQDMVFEEGRQNITILIMLNSSGVFIQPEHVITPYIYTYLDAFVHLVMVF